MKNNRLELLSMLLTDENLSHIPKTYVDVYYEIHTEGNEWDTGSLIEDFGEHPAYIDSETKERVFRKQEFISYFMALLSTICTDNTDHMYLEFKAIKGEKDDAVELIIPDSPNVAARSTRRSSPLKPRKQVLAKKAKARPTKPTKRNKQ